MQDDRHWLASLAGEILTLEVDRELLSAIGALAMDVEQRTAGRDAESLAALIAGLDDADRALSALTGAADLIPRIRGLFRRNLPDAARLLVCRPDALLAGVCGDLPRRFDWDLLDRSLSATGIASGEVGFRLAGDTGSGLSFEIAATAPSGIAPPPGRAVLRMTLSGNAEAAAGLDFPIHFGSVGVDAETANAMDIDYYFAVPANQILAASAAGCLQGLANPFSLTDVAGALHQGPLLAISVRAQGALAISGRLGVGLGVKLAQAADAKIGIDAGFRTSRSGRFRMTLSPGDGTGESGTVLLDLKREQAAEDARNIGIGVTIGLTELVAKLKPQILAHAEKAQGLLDSLDDFLPPSKRIQDEIRSRLAQRIDSTDIEGALRELFGDSPGARALDLLTQQIGSAIDAQGDVWDGSVEALSRRAALDLIEGWKSIPGASLEQAGRDALLVRIQPLLKPVIAGAVDVLRTRLDAVAGGSKDELVQFQRTLAKMVSALKHSGEVKVDARWRWEERQSEGQTLTQQILFRPSRSEPERSSENSAEALYRQALTGSLDSVFDTVLEHAGDGPSAPVSLRDGTLKRFAGIERSSGLELILLDFQLGTNDILKANAEIETDASGNIRVFARSESILRWAGFGEKREFRALNVYELATARMTRRMTFSVSLSQQDEDLEHGEIEQFFSGLQDRRIGLLPDDQAAEAIAETRRFATQHPEAEQSGELRVWLELDDAAVRRLLQLDGSAPFDDNRVYEISIDAMLAGLSVSGSGTVNNNLQEFLTKETRETDLRSLLISLNDERRRYALRPHAGDDAYLVGSKTKYDLLVRISDRARNLAKALRAMREVYQGNPGWDAKNYRDRQEKIDEHIKSWVKGELADKGLRGMFGDDRIRPYMLGFFKALTDLVHGRGDASRTEQLLASVLLRRDEGEREFRLSAPPPPSPAPPPPEPAAGPRFRAAPVQPSTIKAKGPKQVPPTTGREAMADYIFPLSTRPQRDFETGSRNYGAGRSGGRKHAGCDLIMPVGTPILAMADGKVTLGPYRFYDSTYALEVTHEVPGSKEKRVVRYGEIKKQVPKGIRTGARVKKGQVIAYVGRLKSLGRSMLHLEMYKGTKSGGLTQRGANAYSRRSDLMDPTSTLKKAPLLGEVRDKLDDNALKQAPEPQKAQVHGTLNEHVIGGLNVREKPDLSADIVATIKKGDPKTEILGRKTGAPFPYGDRATWYKVRITPAGANQIEGYVIAYFMTPDAPLETLKPVDAATTGFVRKSMTGALMVREKPYLSADKVGSLDPGDQVEVLNPEVEGDIYGWGRNDWIQIEKGDLKGYAAGYFIDIMDPPKDGGTPVSATGPEPDEWDKALLNAPTDGASAKSARDLRGPVGVEASRKMAEQDLDEVLEHADRFDSASGRTGVSPAILAAIASRESRCGKVLDSRGEGDHGHAFGIMQVDKRYHEVAGRPDPYSIAHIEQAAAIFNANLVALKKKFPNWEKGYLLKGAAAAYNYGTKNVQTKEGIDRGTTFDDYGSDVIARAQHYYKHEKLEIFRE